MARKTFEQITDYWQFKGYRLLLDAVDRGRALAKTDKDQLTLGLMTDRMKAIMSDELVKEGKKTWEIENLVLQVGRPDRYSGPLIAGRFQVFESVIAGSYYVVDHTLDDLMIRESGPASNIRRFSSKEEAESLIDQFTTGTVYDRSTSPRGASSHGQPKEGPMAKNAKAVTEARKAAAKADAALDEKPAKKAAPKKAAAAPAKTEAPKSEGRKMPDARAGAPTVANFTRELVMAGKKTEVQIVDAVRAQFPDKSIAKNVAAHYRKQLESQGKNPPPFKEG